jgi:nucleoside-diphosphate-sugar epimerase
VLVTGSSGRVGSAICELLSAEHDVAGLDLRPGPYTTHLGTIVDRDVVASAARDVEAIVHTASLHAPDLNRASPREFVAVNVLGTRNLLDRATALNVRRFVYSSTTSVYGRALVPHDDRAVWVTESLIPQPRDIYDQTKREAERLCQQSTDRGAVPCVSLRFSRCFPEPAHLVATYRLYRGVDVRDVAEAHRLALHAAFTHYEALNISARTPFVPADCRRLLNDPASVIRSYFPDVDPVFASRGWPLPTSIDRVYAIDRAESRLGYHPRYNFRALIDADPQS